MTRIRAENNPITGKTDLIPFTAEEDLGWDAKEAANAAQALIDAPIKARASAKVARDQAVAAIKVTTTAGNTFDGDEVSQGRMARAIHALQATGTPSVTWVLANNTPIEATVAELSEALALSGAAQAALWVIE